MPAPFRRTPLRRSAVPFAVTALLACSLAALPGGVRAQSVLERTPNLSGGWVGEPGVVHFNFLHRFSLSGSRVLNTPTFLLAAPLPGGVLVGGHYASNSGVARESNEFELIGRWRPLSADGASPVALALTGAYNETAGSVDGELSAILPVGPLSLIGVGRAFSEPGTTSGSSWAVGGGGVLRVSPSVALSADVVSAENRTDDQPVAWGVGLQLRIPATPHTFSLQAANTRTATLQGASVGGDDTHWGFEFTIPFTLARYFGGGGPPRDEAPEVTDARRVTMTNQLTYTPATIRIQAGESVTWENTSDIVHTVTADPERAVREESVSLPEGARPFDSGNLAPGESFTRTFSVPGEYVYFCVPHEVAGMVGRVVVTP